jgi:serine phosphatase RsbU (regulator of sigma subunit)
MPGLDAWLYSKPYGGSEAGGDVHYVSSCATGRITRLLVADVSGHGAAVCDAAGVLRGLMRQFVNYLDQTQFVRSMNREFTVLSAANCFATAVVTTYFAPTRHIQVCNAGHPPPLIYRAADRDWSYLNRDDEIEHLEPANVPLGILDLAEYDKFETTLAEGDLVLCYTDSLVESRDLDGEFLLQEGLLRIVRTLDVSSPAAFIPALLKAVEDLSPGNLDADDVTALLFRPNVSTSTPPLRDRLLAPFRVARGAWRSLMSRDRGMPLPDLHPANMGGSLIPALSRLWRRRPKQPGHTT